MNSTLQSPVTSHQSSVITHQLEEGWGAGEEIYYSFNTYSPFPIPYSLFPIP